MWYVLLLYVRCGSLLKTRFLLGLDFSFAAPIESISLALQLWRQTTSCTTCQLYARHFLEYITMSAVSETNKNQRQSSGGLGTQQQSLTAENKNNDVVHDACQLLESSLSALVADAAVLRQLAALKQAILDGSNNTNKVGSSLRKTILVNYG